MTRILSAPSYADVLFVLHYARVLSFFLSHFSGKYFDKRMSRLSTNKFEICGASVSVLHILLINVLHETQLRQISDIFL